MEQAAIAHSGREKSAQKTKAILEGAMQEFLAHGYAAASMDRVAAAAGVSKATIYSHFQDKETLFAALMQQLTEKKFRTVFTLKQQAPQGNPREVLKQLAGKVLDQATHDVHLQAFMRLIVGESGRFPELAQPYIHNIAKPALEILADYFQSHPELKLRDSEAAARIFIGSLVYFILLQEVLAGKSVLPMERDRLIDTLVDLMMAQQD